MLQWELLYLVLKAFLEKRRAHQRNCKQDLQCNIESIVLSNSIIYGVNVDRCSQLFYQFIYNLGICISKDPITNTTLEQHLLLV